MKYEQLSTDYMDDHIAEAMHGREMEWFHYDIDRQNFLDMIAALPPGDPQRAQFAQRVEQVEEQMAVVERVYEALKRRIRNPQAHAAAVERVRLKRAPAA
jgi:hypothetical protein